MSSEISLPEPNKPVGRVCCLLKGVLAPVGERAEPFLPCWGTRLGKDLGPVRARAAGCRRCLPAPEPMCEAQGGLTHLGVWGYPF